MRNIENWELQRGVDEMFKSIDEGRPAKLNLGRGKLRRVIDKAHPLAERVEEAAYKGIGASITAGSLAEGIAVLSLYFI